MMEDLEKSYNTDNREFKHRQKNLMWSHYKNREEQPKDFRQPTLTHLVTLQKLAYRRGYVTAN